MCSLYGKTARDTKERCGKLFHQIFSTLIVSLCNKKTRQWWWVLGHDEMPWPVCFEWPRRVVWPEGKKVESYEYFPFAACVHPIALSAS